MKSLLSCFALLLLTGSLFSQCYGSFEAYISGGASGIRNNWGDIAPGENITERPIGVARFGFGASFVVGPRLLLRTSIQFSQYGERTLLEEGEIRWGTQHDGMGGFDLTIPPEITGDIKLTSRLTYFEGVVALRYHFPVRSTWQPFAEGGMAFGAYGTTTNSSSLGEQSSRKEEFVRPLAPIPRVGFGADYPFNDYFGVYAMSVLQYHVLSISKQQGWSVHPWQASLEFGVRVFMDPR
ncbi:MAG: hypothetical protein AAGA31_01795 [Bacteroidota bacterium]